MPLVPARLMPTNCGTYAAMTDTHSSLPMVMSNLGAIHRNGRMDGDEAYVSKTVRVVDWYCDRSSQRGDVIRMSPIFIAGTLRVLENNDGTFKYARGFWGCTIEDIDG